MKLSTPVKPGKYPFELSLDSRVMLLGSCFADDIGALMRSSGIRACVNPFGTLYNPVSILGALQRLDSAKAFTEGDCIRMGSGSELICSFSHHTSWARPRAEDFLKDANAALQESAALWRECDTLVVTLGTAWVWEREGRVVANCLKRDAREFVHRCLGTDEVVNALRSIVALCGGRRIIWTVSPVRHLWNGAHSNALSKAALLMGEDRLCAEGSGVYFPAFEIVMDELRDYRFYAEDMIHPTATAVGCVWERFCEAFFPAGDIEAMERNRRASRAAAHRPLH